MKITVNQIVHFQNAAKRLKEHVDNVLKALPDGEAGAEARRYLEPIVSAVHTVDNLASIFGSVEINVKG